MPTGLTAAEVVNRALQEIAAQATVTGTNPTFDGSAAGNAAGILYDGVVQTLLREQDWEFARSTVVLVTSATPPLEWAATYVYPSDCLRVRQVRPSSSFPLLDPQPVRWQVAVGEGGGSDIIYASITGAWLVYTTNNVTEAMWDSIFTEAVVRMLASELAMALGGRPDFSEKMLQVSGGLVQSGGGKDS